MVYKKSDDVVAKEKDYSRYIEENDPGEFSSEYTEKAKTALDEYTNYGDFTYDPATDRGYQAARKQYTAGGRQAMKDTLGAATELTGGYDNSYAQVAAQQTFDNYMSQLAALMPEYEDRAYSRWYDGKQQKADHYAAFKAAEDADYAVHRNKVADYNNEANRLYGVYADAQNLDYSMYQDSVDQDQFDRQLAEEQRQYDTNLAEEQRQYNNNAEISKTNAQADYYTALAKYNDSLTDGEDTFYTYSGVNDDGQAVFYKDGKEYAYNVGINPYTGTTNPDAKNGTFKNGYQPNNIGGRKLKETEWETDEFGKTQKVWKTVEYTRRGDIIKYYVWNGKENRYIEVEKPEG